MGRWIIVGISTAILVAGNFLSSLQDPWFQNLTRPTWLTFEFLIPFIWAIIWVCATISAIIIWENTSRQQRSVCMVLYGLIAILTASYSPVVVEFKSLIGGLVVGGAATLLVYILAATVRNSLLAVGLLVPYLIWGPIGTYLTWVLINLNQNVVVMG